MTNTPSPSPDHGRRRAGEGTQRSWTVIGTLVVVFVVAVVLFLLL
ncbi:hypothetical protein [Arthrobacter sp. SX1312]|nr:hypothetical protein [Arthrobacter sp. SX1312]